MIITIEALANDLFVIPAAVPGGNPVILDQPTDCAGIFECGCARAACVGVILLY
jgi:hypothetical protein